MIRVKCKKCGAVLAETVKLYRGVSLPLRCPNCGVKIDRDFRKSVIPIKHEKTKK